MRTNSKIDIAVVLPDKTEYFAKIDPDEDRTQVVREALCKSKYRSEHGHEPLTVNVNIYKLNIVEGAIQRKLINSIAAKAPMGRMTHEYYTESLVSALEDTPVEFHQFIRDASYDRGHCAGLEEVLHYAISIATDLKEPIKRFRDRITGTKQ